MVTRHCLPPQLLLTFPNAGVPHRKGLRSNSSNLMQFALTKGAQ